MPAADLPNYEPILDDGFVDLSEVVLLSENQFVTVNVEQIKEYERIAEDCKKYEDKIKECERIMNEMKLKEKQDQLVSQKR